jgi:inorganic pyrophosphatase
MTRPYRAHPWHGVDIGADAPAMVTAYIELTPEDTIKYELDKASGILKVDRPQLYSNVCPAFYGLIPQTYCAEQVAELCMERTGRKGIIGDGDPLDICILTDKRISTRNVLVDARPIGGLRMLDGNEADDKILAVMRGDFAYDYANAVDDLRDTLVDRLRHYFLTYKQSPDTETKSCVITHVYTREEAYDVIRRSQADYQTHFGNRA